VEIFFGLCRPSSALARVPTIQKSLSLLKSIKWFPRFAYLRGPIPTRNQFTNFFKQSCRRFELAKRLLRSHAFALLDTAVQQVVLSSKTWYFLKALYFSFQEIPGSYDCQESSKNGGSCKELSSTCTPPHHEGTALHHQLQSDAARLSVLGIFRTIARCKGTHLRIAPVPNLCTYPSRFERYRDFRGHLPYEERFDIPAPGCQNPAPEVQSGAARQLLDQF